MGFIIKEYFIFANGRILKEDLIKDLPDLYKNAELHAFKIGFDITAKQNEWNVEAVIKRPPPCYEIN